jgi:hypothetical protein
MQAGICGNCRKTDRVCDLLRGSQRVVAAGGFDQCYNAQALVATGSLLVVATEVTQAANDKEQLAPMIEKLKALPKELGRT